RRDEERECLPDADRTRARTPARRSLCRADACARLPRARARRSLAVRRHSGRPSLGCAALRGTAPRFLALLLFSLYAASAAAEDWPTYLDYAYVYVSADPDALRARLAQYGKDAGIKLEDYARKQFGPGAVDDGSDEETRIRRAAIAELLLYLANG